MQTQSFAPPSWEIPVFGRAATQPLPQWLIDRLTDGSLRINSLGGFDMTAHDASGTSMAGDVVMLIDGEIEFFSPVAVAA